MDQITDIDDNMCIADVVLNGGGSSENYQKLLEHNWTTCKVCFAEYVDREMKNREAIYIDAPPSWHRESKIENETMIVEQNDDKISTETKQTKKKSNIREDISSLPLKQAIAKLRGSKNISKLVYNLVSITFI